VCVRACRDTTDDELARHASKATATTCIIMIDNGSEKRSPPR
jgi:hypothetical protein